MNPFAYLMESDEEAIRLDLKTDIEAVRNQALWAGIKPGMHLADLGCGPGKTTLCLNDLVSPGKAVGVDNSEHRIKYAKLNYSAPGVEYIVGDIRKPLEHLGTFDFVWVRFVLEYYLSNSFEIVKTVSRIVKPGGILCLIDLDCNCLRHYGFPPRLENVILDISKKLSSDFNFDPYVGVKLYSYLFDVGYEDIAVDVSAHNLICGSISDNSLYNWQKKVEIAGKRSGFDFPEYQGGYKEFCQEFMSTISNPRFFHYTPLIICRGRKPLT